MKMKVLSLCTSASLLIMADLVNAVSGTVSDLQGKPIKGALVKVVGSEKKAITNEQGGFGFPLETVDELHIEAEGFVHKILQLHQQQANSDALVIHLMPTALEEVDVIGLPLHVSTLASVQPVSVIGKDELASLQRATLGETLKQEVGVHSTYFGPVASSPIIRGLDGPRVLVTQNGIDVGDASRVGPDHVVTGEAATAQQIEILRGPSTLFYGSGAIGGVVNIVDNRVPKSNAAATSISTHYDTVADETNVSGMWNGGTDSFAFHADSFWREGSDYDIPGNAEVAGLDDDHDDEGEGESEEGEAHSEESSVLENSEIRGHGINVGASWLLSSGYVGLSYGRMERLNGIPGHGHGHEDEEPEDDDVLGAEESEEERVQSDLVQNRWQLQSEIDLNNEGFWSGINSRLGYSDYRHQEVESGSIGTTFTNDTWEGKVDFLHREFLGWRGAVSVDVKRIDFAAVGEEAFTPPSVTGQWALALLEEKHLTDDLLLQVGMRVEQVDLTADDLEVPEGLHGHDEDEEPDGGEEESEFYTFGEQSFTPISLSLGAVWDFTDGYNASAAFTHAQRAPNAAEIFSLGPHIGTNSYEIGTLFELHQEDDELDIELTSGIEKEVSNNFDIGLRKTDGAWGFAVNLFFNDVEDFYFLNNTGLTTEDLFEELDEEPEPAAGGEAPEEDEHGHGEEILPVFQYQQADARLYGLELSAAWQINEQWRLSFWGDQVRAELKSGGDLPRTPPRRIGTRFQWQSAGWNAELSANHYFDQTNTANFETPTDGYTLVDMEVRYDVMGNPSAGQAGMTVFLQGMNLGDTDARVHSSFIKDVAPLPGRNIRLGLRAQF